MAVDDDAADEQLSGPPVASPASTSLDAEDTPPPAAADSTIPNDDQRQADQHETDDDNTEALRKNRLSGLRSPITIGAALVVVIASLTGWLGYRTYQGHQAQAQRDQFIAIGRQGALDLTSIDYTKVEADVQRILDSSTGAFHDDFKRRSQPFIEVVKKAQSKSEGTITAAGLQSQDGDQAQVLVAVSVKTTNAGAPEQDPRRWRMLISVAKVKDGAKVSDVQFVP
jgi:Mce-associated membrane protein